MKYVLLLLLICLANGASADTVSDQKDAARIELLVGKFKQMCADQPIEFDSLATKATAMKLRVVEAPLSPSSDGNEIKQKAWSVAEEEGFPLVVRETLNPHLVTCAVVGTVHDFDKLYFELTTSINLTSSPLERISNKKRLYTWKGLEPNTSLQLQAAKQPNDWYVMIKIGKFIK